VAAEAKKSSASAASTLGDCPRCNGFGNLIVIGEDEHGATGHCFNCGYQTTKPNDKEALKTMGPASPASGGAAVPGAEDPGPSIPYHKRNQ
jgi:Zn ribbon nucleic-acid-binding protein